MGFFSNLFGSKGSANKLSEAPAVDRTCLDSMLERAGLTKYKEKLELLKRSCVRLHLSKVDEDELPIGSSKIGGRPDLPDEMDWPFETERPPSDRDRSFPGLERTSELLPLSFVAQLDLAEISKFDETSLLPTEGWLYFFYTPEQDVWGFDPRDHSGFKVFYFEGDRSQLSRREFPDALREHDRFQACRILPETQVSLPELWAESMRGFFGSEQEEDAYSRMVDDGLVNKMLGYADPVQGDMEIECEMVANGHYIGDGVGLHDPRRTSAEKTMSDWRLLLQVDSNDEAGMMWGDVGRIYYWIKKEDLENRRFDRTWFCYQCC